VEIDGCVWFQQNSRPFAVPNRCRNVLEEQLPWASKVCPNYFARLDKASTY